ncbi:MAG: DUF448 domain-containing protein [Mariprofundaceae bacterium]|nr:DUF448 domain-containing protein [Mariprofundaceae bacterium]
MHKPSQRTCFACRSSQDKTILLRLVVDEQGLIWPDLLAKLPGRGVYLCMQNACLTKLSDKRLQVLKRDFSPQLPQLEALMYRLSDMLALRVTQLMKGMKKRSAVGRDAVMHQLWGKSPVLLMFAADAGAALLRQVKDAVAKRDVTCKKEAARTKVLVSTLDAQALGLILGRDKVSVVAFTKENPLAKLQQFCVWQEQLEKAGYCASNRESKVTNGE